MTNSDLIERIEAWLRAPGEGGVEFAQTKAETLLHELRAAVGSDPGSRATLGPLIGQVEKTRKSLSSMEAIPWQAVSSGHLAIGHRPGAGLITALKLQGATHVLTLLAESEGGVKIGNQVRKAGLEWLWLPMASAALPGSERRQEIEDLFAAMKAALRDGGRIYVHCSAGIHRTGMIAYGFLRSLNLDPDAARDLLMALRPETANNSGAHRLAWGDAFSEGR